MSYYGSQGDYWGERELEKFLLVFLQFDLEIIQ